MSKKFLFVDTDGVNHEANAFESADFINVSAGAADAGKPIVLDAAGQIDASMIDDADVDHENLSGLLGGAASDHYHMTQAQHDTLTDGSDASSLHIHDGRYFTETEISSVANGEGASLVGIEDANSYFTAVNVEGALDELYQNIALNGVEYTAGGTIAKGDLVYISANDTVLSYSSTTDFHKGIGLAFTAESAASPVRVAANDTVISGAIVGGVAGTPYYWDGSALTTTLPTGSGAYVYQAGVAKNATDLHVEVRIVKKNL